jgi:hypothetical protein
MELDQTSAYIRNSITFFGSIFGILPYSTVRTLPPTGRIHPQIPPTHLRAASKKIVFLMPGRTLDRPSHTATNSGTHTKKKMDLITKFSELIKKIRISY